jgi:predicted nuclease with RNAse H fold
LSIVGLDLAGVETRPTGFCLLKGMAVETDLLYTDKEIIEQTLLNSPKLVAIDAPLYLPPGRTSLDGTTGPHFRESDRELLKIGIRIFPLPWDQCAN